MILGGGGGGGGGEGVLAREGAALESLPFSASNLALVLFVPVTEAFVGLALGSSTMTASLPSACMISIADRPRKSYSQCRH